MHFLVYLYRVHALIVSVPFFRSMWLIFRLRLCACCCCCLVAPIYLLQYTKHTQTQTQNPWYKTYNTICTLLRPQYCLRSPCTQQNTLKQLTRKPNSSMEPRHSNSTSNSNNSFRVSHITASHIQPLRLRRPPRPQPAAVPRRPHRPLPRSHMPPAISISRTSSNISNSNIIPCYCPRLHSIRIIPSTIPTARSRDRIPGRVVRIWSTSSWCCRSCRPASRMARSTAPIIWSSHPSICGASATNGRAYVRRPAGESCFFFSTIL